ncbi:hypothetical protein BJV38_002889 [Clostridium beijerinckii]|uniref:hypothetical protein n=1 Tax=Clostridium beijerinckii TaxID=1520 RepID=UPI00156E3753|nr:hypothetical protein [Clostridium beijerinckii]NRT34524.1 hypothetical protein [Clostridium beijerinckii]NRT46046.1 hypothetical protein [Clostridium beijerinckii]NRZ19952.1 hypothetical protein [Clostridium beijerinckii]
MNENDFIIRLPYYVKDMNENELREYFPTGTKKSVLMRSIIMNEKEFSTIDYDRTLRGLWYSTVKPTLDKLGLLDAADQTEEGLTKWDATLSKYVADLLRRGLITYKDLHISDTSRQKRNPSNLYNIEHISTYGNQITTAPYPNIIIATEKDTVYNIISDIAKLFGCSCISCKGQNSLGAMELLVRGILRKKQMYNSFVNIHILTMTDYDPAGYYIAEALEKQVEDILHALGCYDLGVTITRVGITPDQLDIDTVHANKYTPKPANMEKWMERTNGIYGEPKGLELDALTPTQIREIFVSSLKYFINTDEYNHFIKKSYITNKVLDTLQPKVDRITEIICDRYADKLIVEEFDLYDLATRGYSTIPVYRICDNSLDTDIRYDTASFIADEINDAS